jgi:hypothetical protein
MLVLDANILIRAVLASRVLSLLRKHAGQMAFLAPDTAFQEARGQCASDFDRIETGFNAPARIHSSDFVLELRFRCGEREIRDGYRIGRL